MLKNSRSSKNCIRVPFCKETIFLAPAKDWDKKNEKSGKKLKKLENLQECKIVNKNTHITQRYGYVVVSRYTRNFDFITFGKVNSCTASCLANRSLPPLAGARWEIATAPAIPKTIQMAEYQRYAHQNP